MEIETSWSATAGRGLLITPSPKPEISYHTTPLTPTVGRSVNLRPIRFNHLTSQNAIVHARQIDGMIPFRIANSVARSIH